MSENTLIRIAEKYEALDDLQKRQIDFQVAAIALYKEQTKEQEKKHGQIKELEDDDPGSRGDAGRVALAGAR